MRELLSTLKLKEKLTIALSMAGLALMLILFLVTFSHCSASNHEHEYDYHLELVDGKFNLVGYCDVIDCPAPDYVEQNISGVSLVSAVRPTCVGEGKRVYTYQRGDLKLDYVEILPVTSHRYNCDKIRIQSGRVTLECVQPGCTNPTLTLERVSNFHVDQYVEGDCFSPPRAVFTYTADGRTSNFIAYTHNERPHMINGTFTDKLVDSKGQFAYGQQGITLVNASASHSCGSVLDGYYTCEKCAQIVNVKVKKPDHHLVYSASDVISNPTVHEAGALTARCSNAGCSYSERVKLPAIMIGFNSEIIREATEQAPMLVKYTYNYRYGLTVKLNISVGDPIIHNYIFELKLVPTGNGYGQYNLVGNCEDENCPHPEVVIENVPVTPIDPLCTNNKRYFGYEYKGTMYYIETPQTAKPHDFDYDINEATLPTMDSTGEIVVTCSRSDCSYDETVILPKVQVGVNAEVLFDAPNYTLLEYKYNTADGCEIIIPIIIYK